MAIPTTATDVFYVKDGTADYTADFPADLLISTRTSSSPNYVFNRLTGSRYLLTESSNAEADGGSGMTKIFQDDTGVNLAGPWWGASLSNTVGWLWRRAPNYFDMVTYTGTGTSGKAITGLGFRPGFLMIKETSSTGNWAIVDGTRSPFSETAGNYLWMNLSDAEGGASAYLTIDDDGFTINSSDSDTNASGQTYMYMAFKGSYSDYVS